MTDVLLLLGKESNKHELHKVSRYTKYGKNALCPMWLKNYTNYSQFVYEFELRPGVVVYWFEVGAGLTGGSVGMLSVANFWVGVL